MTRERVKQALSAYLEAPPPGYALLLDGAWGVGKSYFWQHFKGEPLRKLGRTAITISVAGLSTLEDLENAMFIVSVKDAMPSAIRETCSVVWRAAMRVMKVDPNDIKISAEVKSGVTVVCIDDVERFSGDFKTLFGFIKELLDEAGLHVVLIADERRTIEAFADYGRYRERIIQRFVRLQPDTKAFYKSIVNGYKEQNLREVLLDVQQWAVELFQSKNINNLRTIRSILDQMRLLLLAMKWPLGKKPKIQSLFSAVTFYVLAITKDAANEDAVSQVFMQYDPSMAVGILGRHAAGPSKDPIDQLQPVRQLVQELGLDGDVHNWPHSPGFSCYVTGGDVDADGIAGDFLLFESQQEGRSALKRLESPYALDDSELAACVSELRKEVEQQKLESLQELWEAYCRLIDLTTDKLTGWSPEGFRAFFIQSISSYPIEGIHHTVEDFHDRSRSEGDEQVWKALEALQSRIEAMVQANRNKLAQRWIVEGEGVVHGGVSFLPFGDADPQEIHNRLESAGREGLRRMREFYRARTAVATAADSVERELVFAEKLAVLAETHQTDAIQITQVEVAWRKLATQLRLFVTVRGKGRSR